MTEIRKAEIALAKYVGYYVHNFLDLYQLQLGNAPIGSGVMLDGPVEREIEEAAKEQVWLNDCPAFASDESLLSTLMKLLAGKGLIVEMAGHSLIDGGFMWRAVITYPHERFVAESKDGEATTPIRALSTCAFKLPEVQELIEQMPSDAQHGNAQDRQLT